MRDRGSVAQQVYTALSGYFVDDDEPKLTYLDIEFDIESESDAAKHKKRLERALAPLAKLSGTRVLLYVNTHSQDTAGTLYYGTDAAAPTNEMWFATLLPKSVHAVLAAQQTDVFMLCCGALVSRGCGLDTLQAYIQETAYVRRMFAFESTAFMATLGSSFFTTYALKFLIECVKFDDHQFGAILNQSLNLSRHSNVLVLHAANEWSTVTTRQYFWWNATVRPGGVPLPEQCPACHNLYKMKDRSVVDVKGVEGKWLVRSL
ncbi:hypothetical protein C2E23DRAFT_883362 [Lenzites betulinus]|nr:hypothetical protein C2E23DRAFT_883362 [Lenzites betulinus]